MSEKQSTTSKRRRLTRRTFIGSGAAALITAPQICRALGANDRIGVGFIGTGGRGHGCHINVVKRMKAAGANVDLVAVCDTYRPRMERAAKTAGTNPKMYSNHKELLLDPNVDCVCIATPDHSHGYQALDAVLAGKHVYCEKPVTHWQQFELTKRLADAAAESNSVFQLGSQGMSDSAWHIIRGLVKDGLIGKPLHGECGYFRVGDWGERGMPIDDPNIKPGKDLDWEAFLGEDRPKREFDVSRYFRWRMYSDYAGGPSTDLFPHSMTPVVFMMGLGMPSMAVGTGGMFRYTEREVPDTFNMLADYPEKATIAVLGTQGNNFSSMNGDRGAGSRIPFVRGWDGTLTVDRKTNEVVFFPAEGSNKKSQRFKIEHGESMEGHWGNLFDCIRKGDKNTFSPMDLAFKVQTAIQMAMQGLMAGKVAKYDAVGRKIIL